MSFLYIQHAIEHGSDFDKLLPSELRYPESTTIPDQAWTRFLTSNVRN